MELVYLAFTALALTLLGAAVYWYTSTGSSPVAIDPDVNAPSKTSLPKGVNLNSVQDKVADKVGGIGKSLWDDKYNIAAAVTIHSAAHAVAKRVAKSVSQKATAKAAQLAEQKAEQTATKAAVGAAERDAEAVGEKAAAKVVSDVTEKIGARVTSELAESAGGRVAAFGAEAASEAELGPAGWIELAVQAASLLVDILDPAGYNTFTTNDVNTRLRNSVEAATEVAYGQNKLEYPSFFALAPHFAKEHKIAQAAVIGLYTQEAIKKLSPADAELLTHTPTPDAVIDRIVASSQALASADHVARDRAYLKYFVAARPDPAKAKAHFAVYPSKSTAQRYGVSLSVAGAQWWIDEHTAEWFAHFDKTKKMNTSASYDPSPVPFVSNVYRVRDKTNPGKDDAPNMVTKRLKEPICMKLPLGQLVAFCQKPNSKGINPAEYGVKFDQQTAMCRYTPKYCSRMGLVYTDDAGLGNCKTAPGQNVAELIFGTTITRGIMAAGKAVATGFGAHGCRDANTNEPQHPTLDPGTCCNWTADCNDKNSCFYCSEGNEYSLVGGQSAGSSVHKFGGRYCGSSRVCSGSTGNPTGAFCTFDWQCTSGSCGNHEKDKKGERRCYTSANKAPPPIEAATQVTLINRDGTNVRIPVKDAISGSGSGQERQSCWSLDDIIRVYGKSQPNANKLKQGTTCNVYALSLPPNVSATAYTSSGNWSNICGQERLEDIPAGAVMHRFHSMPCGFQFFACRAGQSCRDQNEPQNEWTTCSSETWGVDGTTACRGAFGKRFVQFDNNDGDVVDCGAGKSKSSGLWGTSKYRCSVLPKLTYSYSMVPNPNAPSASGYCVAKDLTPYRYNLSGAKSACDSRTDCGGVTCSTLTKKCKLKAKPSGAQYNVLDTRYQCWQQGNIVQ